MTLQIHCGDCAAETARQVALPGEIVVWHDSPAVGPCARDRATHRRLRATWWSVDPQGMQDPHDLPRDRPLVLWFGPDPWEQLALLELLAGLPAEVADVSLVRLERGVARLATIAGCVVAVVAGLFTLHDPVAAHRRRRTGRPAAVTGTRACAGRLVTGG